MGTNKLGLVLPLKVDKVIKWVRRGSWAFIGFNIILLVAFRVVIPETQIHLLFFWIIIGYVFVWFVYAIVIRIIAWNIKKKAVNKIKIWLEDKYGYTVNNSKQLLPFLKHDWSENASSFVSNPVSLWSNNASMEVTVPYVLIETHTDYSLFNINTRQPELPTKLKKAIDYWEFFWSFNEGIYIPVPPSKTSEIPNSYVNFASPLDDFKVLKIWGEEYSFKEAWEKGELPYHIATVPSMQALSQWLHQFQDDNVLVELEIQGNTTRLPVEDLNNAINVVYNKY